MSIVTRLPSISAIGVLSWDKTYLIDEYPAEGGYTVVRDAVSGPGGTTGNIAMAARKLGASVALFGALGTDGRAEQILCSLREAGVRTEDCFQKTGDTDLSVILVSKSTGERTIVWQQGPHIERRDRIDVDALFMADITVVDCIDPELRRFLIDLPAHSRPTARLLGTLTYLADVVADDKLDMALRHDILVGNEREYRELVGCDDAETCHSTVARLMPGTNLRLAVMTQSERGSIASSRDCTVRVPGRRVSAVDSTGAGDAFTGALAFALAQRWDLERSLAFANTVASFVVASVGAQSGLPEYTQAIAAMAQA